jgi:predicted enzyme related to lactoylglutathione lyase
MAVRTRRPGEFCWINILTARPDEAKTFFSGLLGWSFGDIPGMGYSIKVGGRDIGGLFDLNGPGTPPGTVAQIGVMVKVEDADAMAAKVAALGGTSQPAFDVGPQGRMVVCVDPNGAAFDLWQGRASGGTDVDSLLHGAPSWFETVTTDVARATAFYQALFGWSAESTPMGDFTYWTFKQGADFVGGLFPMPPEMQGVAPHWTTYFTVTDVDETVKAAEALGGKLCMPVKDIPGVGRFCGISSPQGVTFYAITYSQ